MSLDLNETEQWRIDSGASRWIVVTFDNLYLYIYKKESDALFVQLVCCSDLQLWLLCIERNILISPNLKQLVHVQ